MPAPHVQTLISAPDVEGVSGAASGDDRRAIGRLGRLLSYVEDAPDPVAVLDLVPDIGEDTAVLGITGPPGAGKSTLVTALVQQWRRHGEPVAVLAVDPSSEETGGALLGDRIRMQVIGEDPGVFLRSVAHRGHLGGLSARLPVMVRALGWAGFRRVLVETVGVGQSEIAVASAVDTSILVVCPGQGDAIQAAKAGVLEVADLLVVNKADLPGAREAVRDLRSALLLAPKSPAQWHPPIVTAIAGRDEVDEVVAAATRHREWLTDTGELGRRRGAAVMGELRGVLSAHISARIGEIARSPQFAALPELIRRGEVDRGAALQALLAAVADTLSGEQTAAGGSR